MAAPILSPTAALPQPGALAQLTLLEGDVRKCLRELPAESVHCTVTSPPYYGLRDYGTEPQVWGGDPECEHTWDTVRTPRPNGSGGSSPKQDANPGSFVVDAHDRATYSGSCSRCGAWRGELGQEPSVALYVAHMVDVFREVRRVLRSDGVCWLNIGDSYAGSWGARGRGENTNAPRPDLVARHGTSAANRNPSLSGLKPKDLCLVPQRLAIALQDDGWYVRSDVIWHKPNAMPGSYRDRPVLAHEYLWLLAKSERYFYDWLAETEPYSETTLKQLEKPYRGKGRKDYAGAGVQNPSDAKRRILEAVERSPGRRVRTVWSINKEQSSEEHFAAYPEDLVARCIRLTTSEAGACPHCGTPWQRLVEEETSTVPVAERTGRPAHLGQAPQQSGWYWQPPEVQSLGWEPGCKCPEHAPIPCTVLDPFHGTGTTGAVAQRLERSCIGIELKPEYHAIEQRRLCQQRSLFTEVA